MVRLSLLADCFFENLFIELDLVGIDVSNFHLDHICYRVSSITEYEAMKAELLIANESLLIESVIGGRLISTFELKSPFKYFDREIFILEIPSPKMLNAYESGFEHAEFVIDFPFSELISLYPSLNFDISGLKKQHNPELKIQLKTCAVKFHHKSLKRLIYEETSKS